MPPSKGTRNEVPQISMSSWILGGPLITKPSRLRRQPVLVTTRPPKVLKAPIVIEKKLGEEKEEEKKPEEGKKEEKKQEGQEEKEGKKEEENAEETAVKDKDKVSDTQKTDTNIDWTPERDALLLRLKAENTSWKEISIKMSAAKSAVVMRFKELQKEGSRQAASSDNAAAKIKEGSKDEKSDEADEKKAEAGQNANGGGGGERCDRLKPDDYWTRQDCELLEMLETRYQKEKWMSIQASFYNWTGRMVTAETIEQKFSGAKV